MRLIRNGPPVPCAGTGVPLGIFLQARALNSCLAKKSPCLLAVVIDHAQGKANAALQSAYPMPQASPVKSAAALHWTMPRREDEGLPLLRGDDFSFGLSSRLLLHNHEFTSFVVSAWPAQKAGHLQRESNSSVHVLVEAVEIPVFVMQQQRRCPRLSMLRASLEKVGMTFGKNVRQTKGLIPFIGERSQERITMLPQLLNVGRQRIVKVFVIAAAKAVARHDDVTAEWIFGTIQVYQVCAF